MVGKVEITLIKQSKRAVVNLDLELGLARFSNLELDLEFKTDFQSCTGLNLTQIRTNSHKFAQIHTVSANSRSFAQPCAERCEAKKLIMDHRSKIYLAY